MIPHKFCLFISLFVSHVSLRSFREAYFEKSAFLHTYITILTTHKCTYTNLSDKDTPEKCPDDVSKVQQHHVFEQQCWQGKLRHKIPQTLRLALCDNICPIGRNERNRYKGFHNSFTKQNLTNLKKVLTLFGTKLQPYLPAM